VPIGEGKATGILEEASQGGSGLSATDGTSYARLLAPGVSPTGSLYADGTGESASEPLCSPLHAGATYSLNLDLADDTALAVPTFLEIWGSTTPCSKGQLLWSSPVPGTTWKTYCATLMSSQETTYLTVRANLSSTSAGPFSSGAVYVDHMVPVAACPSSLRRRSVGIDDL
jgi:hypothetical protein